MKIWVLKDNPYKRFYEKLGGSQIAVKNIKEIDVVSFGWSNIKSIM